MEKEARIMTKVFHKFKVWTKIDIRLGTMQTSDDFRRIFKNAGCRISEDAEDILNKPDFTIVAKETVAEFVIASVEAFGFRGLGVYYEDICSGVQEELGLELCPPEGGPQLCLCLQSFAYKNDLLGKEFYIGMKPIAGSGGALSVFKVMCDDDGEFRLDVKWLGSRSLQNLSYFHFNELLVFLSPANNT